MFTAIQESDMPLELTISTNSTADEFIDIICNCIKEAIYIPLDYIKAQELYGLLDEETKVNEDLDTAYSMFKTIGSKILQQSSGPLLDELNQKFNFYENEIDLNQKAQKVLMKTINKKYNEYDRLSPFYNKLYENEKITNRRWKKHIKQHWDPKRLESLLSNLIPCHNPNCDCEQTYIHRNRLRIFRDPLPSHQKIGMDQIFNVYPEAYLDIRELIRTKFKSERILNELISTNSIEQKCKDTKIYHALIKKSKFKYEYIVGFNIDNRICQYDIVFHDSIVKVKDDHLTNIHRQMSEFAKEVPNKAITFNEHGFVFKPNPNVSLNSIIKLYRNAHN